MEEKTQEIGKDKWYNKKESLSESVLTFLVLIGFGGLMGMIFGKIGLLTMGITCIGVSILVVILNIRDKKWKKPKKNLKNRTE
jgi:hypothetical protein